MATISPLSNLKLNLSHRVFTLCFLLYFSNLSKGKAEDFFTNIGPDNSYHAVFILLSLLISGVLFFISLINLKSKPVRRLGFLAITPHRSSKFFPLSEDIENMEKVVATLADENTNVYSNLSKITLTIKNNKVFLEDKNYKISILVNRRRSRRCFLNDGDILDMGELTLVFHSAEPHIQKTDSKRQKSSHLIPRVRRTQGNLIKNTPTLIPMDARKKAFFLTKNITFIGRSETNDLIPRAKAVSLRHSKIELVAGKYKITDLSSENGTYINGKHTDSRLLRDGDEIAFESVKYIFSLSGQTRLP